MASTHTATIEVKKAPKNWKPFRLLRVTKCNGTCCYVQWSTTRDGRADRRSRRPDDRTWDEALKMQGLHAQWTQQTSRSKRTERRVQSILDDVNGRSTRHVFTSPDEILQCMDIAECRRVTLSLTKRDSLGMRVRCHSGLSVSKSYKYQRTGTEVVLIYRRSGWYIEAIKSIQLYPTEGGLVDPILTPGQAKLALDAYQRTQFSLQQ